MGIADEIKRVETTVEKLRHKLSIEEAVLNRLKAIQAPSGRRRRRDGSLIKGIENVLRDSTEPMAVSQITDKLKERGITSSSKYGLGPMVASALRKDEKTFVRLSRGHYDLRERNSEENKQSGESN